MPLPGGIWHEFLVCGHAVKAIDAWYVGGVRQPTTSAEGDPETEAYFLIPGYSAWAAVFGAPLTTTINDRTYTTCYLKEGSNSPLDMPSILGGSTPFTVNLKGIENVGDGSGDLIITALGIYKHLMQNWVFGDYRSGPWLSTETFDDPDLLPVMDDASFDEAQDVSKRRLSDDVGYLGAGGVGLDGNFVSIRDLIQLLNRSCDVDSALNRLCQFMVSMIDDTAAVLTLSPELSDIHDILKGSFDISDDFSNHFNVVPFTYGQNYVSGTNTPWRHVAHVRSEESITHYQAAMTMESQQLDFVRNTATAEDIVQRKLLRHKDPPRLVRFDVATKGFNIELGDMRVLTHFGGIGAVGWVRNPARVQRHTADTSHQKVDLEAYDMARLFATVFILGDEDVLPPLWPDATVFDRIYGYLADETTTEFSDGAPGKRLR